MAAPIRPASAKAYGQEKVSFVLTIATPTAPTIAEITAASALDISCTLFDSFARPSQNTNQVSKAKRVCDTRVFQQIGDTNYAGGEVRYAIDPQAIAGSDAKKTWEKLGGATGGVTGFVVLRQSIAVATDFAAGQFVSVWPVELGPGVITKEGDGEAAESAATQTYVITGPPTPLVAIAA